MDEGGSVIADGVVWTIHYYGTSWNSCSDRMGWLWDDGSTHGYIKSINKNLKGMSTYMTNPDAGRDEKLKMWPYLN